MVYGRLSFVIRRWSAMNPYSHVVVASKVERYLCPSDREQYYLGAVVPDVRYYSGVSRWQTHLPLEQVAAFGARYPDLQSFILGYLVHCAVDEIDLSRFILRRFPLSLARPLLPAKAAAMLIEYRYLETTTVDKRVSEASNQMLTDLGIDEATVVRFARQINQFLAEPSLEAGLTLAYRLGLSDYPGLEKYLWAAQLVGCSRVLRKLAAASVDRAQLDRYVGPRVMAAVRLTPQSSICSEKVH